MIEINLENDENMEEIYLQLANEYIKKETIMFTYVVKEVIKNPIKGEITEKKLKKRGITINQKTTLVSSNNLAVSNI